MSVCDEEWGEIYLVPGEPRFCPAAITYGGDGDRVCGCNLMFWHEWLGWGERFQPLDICISASAFKVMLESFDSVLVAVPKDADYVIVHFPSMKTITFKLSEDKKEDGEK